ncbi:O-antigen ligase family protein [Vibrio bivalvicida]|uniref:O-antigen ligase family protein n=1 Tax=Vibrio bivalvicida TaxID=1276888 RepID=A0ABV4MP67_9VIBR
MFDKKITQSISYGSLFLVPFLLLWTHNLSVLIIALISIYSIIYISYNRAIIKLERYDIIVIGMLSLYFIINIPNVIIDLGKLRYFQGGIRLLLCIPIYIFLRYQITSEDKAIDYISKGTIAGSIGALLMAIYQYFYLSFDRVDGYLFSINFGYLAGSLAFLALTLAMQSKLKVWLYFSFVFSVVSLLLTYTRGAIFSIPILLMFIIFLNYKKLSFKYVVLGASVLILSSVLMYKLSPSFKQRIDFTYNEFSLIASGHTEYSASAGGRLLLWKAATEGFKLSPFVGLTYSERETLNQELYKQGEVTHWVTTVSRGHAHSQYFEMLVSNGVLGVIGAIGMLLAPCIYFSKAYLRTHSPITLTASVFLAAFCIFGLTEVLLQANLISAFFGFMLAAFFAIWRNSSNYDKST